MISVAVVGSGPNGLTAAYELARRGYAVTVYEKHGVIGGGARTAPLIQSDVLHDLCSAVHPMALASPFFKEFGLAKKVDFVVPEVSYAHPLGEGRDALAYRDVARTAAALGSDGATWSRFFQPLIDNSDAITRLALFPLLHPSMRVDAYWHLGSRVLSQAVAGRFPFQTEAARSLITGVMAHATTRLPSIAGAAVGVVLSTHAHAAGWPIPIGGSQSIVTALASEIVAEGGTIVVDHEVTDLRELTQEVIVLNTSPRAAAGLIRHEARPHIVRALERFSYGPGAFKLDLVTSEPIPWRNPDISKAGTVHLGGPAEAIRQKETALARGKRGGTGAALVSEPTRFDASRAPEGRHVVWSYMHVPNDSPIDYSDELIALIEEHAPGFRDTILGRRIVRASEWAQYNPNYVGGDIAGGALNLRQLIARPLLSPRPWSLGRGVYLASASVAPGSGVHGMAGYGTARDVVKRFG